MLCHIAFVIRASLNNNSNFLSYREDNFDIFCNTKEEHKLIFEILLSTMYSFKGGKKIICKSGIVLYF